MSNIWIEVKSGERLEGIIHQGHTGQGGAVVCHPHPFHGGDMWNNVVMALEEGFTRAGMTTVRFNFRGVGASTGFYDEGNGEVEDVESAYRYLKDRIGDSERIVLAGYSFGAWTCARAAAAIGDAAIPVVLAAYPFSVYPTNILNRIRNMICFINGSSDDIAPMDRLLPLYERLEIPKDLLVISTDHFYQGKEKEISDYVALKFGKEIK